MCGISGLVRLGPGSPPVDEAPLRAAAGVQSHRGPDAEGVYRSPNGRAGLAFRRLSIVDLATGDQPMANEDETLWLVFNGEIYNHRSIRERMEARGHRYRSHSDSEAILHLYEEYGPDCIHHLRGMFAFGLWDEKRQRLLLARDRLGVKPLVFGFSDDRRSFAFASEIKALFALPELKPRLDEDALWDYLSFAAVPAPRTFFQGVSKLRAGERLILEADGAERRELYWQPRPDPSVSEHLSDGEYVERVEAAVRESIGLRLMSDVPYGAFLSGGVDSSLNVALMSELAGHPVSTYSVAIEGDAASDELALARRVAERYGSDHHEVVIGEAAFSTYLPQLAWQIDEPLADPVCVPLHAVSDEARRNGTIVVQVGEGSDEIFAGYRGYAFFSDFHRRAWQPYRVLPRAVRGVAARAARPFLSGDKLDVLNRAAQDGEAELYWGGAVPFYDEPKRRLAPGGRGGEQIVASLYRQVDANRPSARQLDRMIGIELLHRLPELLLMRLDKVTMASSIEAREPYLDHKLVELALALPPRVKYRDGVSKWVLKQVAERAGLERDLIYRPKRGFCGSATNMLSPRLLAAAEASILESPLLRDRLDFGEVRRLVGLQRSGREDHNFQIWTLWVLAEWHRAWFEGSSLTPTARVGR